MRFTELICRAAAARFTDRAQLGVRLSPVVLGADEAGELVRVARELLPPSTFVAVAAPGAPEHDDERTCTSSGERAAERATAWRNLLTPDDRILYVSVRRLGRAGGLEDTLFELTEAELREGVLAWCETDGPVPRDIVAALREAGVVGRVEARSLCAFAASVARVPAEEIGRLLPLLDLAADSRLAEDPKARIVANARWVRSVATADNRGTGKLGAAALEVRRELSSAIALGDGGGGLRTVDLGRLSTEELNSDTPKGTRPPRGSAASGPKPVTPPRPITPPKPSTGPKPGVGAPPPSRTPGGLDVPAAGSGGEGPPASPPDAAEPIPTLPERDAALGTPTPPGAGGALPTPDPDPAPVAPGPRGAGPPPPLEGGEEESGAGVGGTDVGPPTGPRPGGGRPGERPGRARGRRLGGPWTEAIHAEERGLDAPLPEGVRRLVAAVLAGSGDGLVWTVAGNPATVVTTPPKALREPVPEGQELLDPEALAAWRAARAAVVDLLGDGALDALPRAPYTVLSDERLTPLAERLLVAWRAVFDAAILSGPAAREAALSLDTATVVSLSGRAVVVLSPLHPIVLGPLLERLPGMARAAQARGPARSVLAASMDTPLAVPSGLPSRWGELPWRPSPRVTPIFGALTAPDPALDAAVTQSVLALARLHPHAALCLTVAAEDAPQAVARGVAEALQQDSTIRRAVVHAREAVALSEAHEPLNTSGRLWVEPIAGALRPHLRVHVTSDGGVPAVPPKSLEGLDLSWRLAERGPIDLGSVEPPRDTSAWVLCVGPRLQGAPRRPQLVVSRGTIGASAFAILSSDPRGAARALTRTYKAVGVERLTPRTIENLTRDLASGAAGLVSLDEAGDGRVAALLLELAVGRALGEDAVVAGLDGEPLRVLMGVRGGAFCAGAAWSPAGVWITLGAGAISRPLGEDDARALERGLEIVRLASREGEVGAAARHALIAALGSGWRRHEEGPPVVEAIMGGATLIPQVLGVGPSGSALRVEGRDVRVAEVNARMLEELAVGMRG